VRETGKIFLHATSELRLLTSGHLPIIQYQRCQLKILKLRSELQLLL